MERAQLMELTREFLDAFNRNDLDAVMCFFADGSFYEEINGKRSAGKTAIRAALTPQFQGAYGKMQFIYEDIFADAETGKVMASWHCSLTVEGEPTSWRGLDILRFVGDKVVQKLTYAKAKMPMLTTNAVTAGRVSDVTPVNR
jgi:ketosteroid isomerase-like protein